MPDSFLQGLNKLLADEQSRVATLQKEAEIERQEAAIRDSEIEELQEKIVVRMREVSSLFSNYAGDVNKVSHSLGFSADVSGFNGKGDYVLKFNLHMHSTRPGSFLKLTVKSNGMGSFDPQYATPFLFLPAHDSVYEENVARFVRESFITLSDHERRAL